MKTYIVGGAVRDSLLGLPVKDRDYVVVGSTPEQMRQLGFKPVGADFPVFLHPQTQEEYALARTERKTARGYHGFSFYAAPDVTLEQDLARRDFTINAMARDETGELIDPYGGRQDLASRTLRHVSEAFAEDPVRILRAARFMARFSDFTIAPETLTLMRCMVADGEVDALVPERVWQELARGLMEATPSRFFTTLRECGALKRLLPEIDCLFGVPQNPRSHPEIDTGIHVMLVLDEAARRNYSLPVRFAALLHDLGKGTTPKELWPNHGGHEEKGMPLVKTVSQRLRAPNACRNLAILTAQWHGQAHQADTMGAEKLLDILLGTDAIRQPERFGEFLQACTADFYGRPGYAEREFAAIARLQEALAVVMAIDAGAVAHACANPADIPAAIRAARLAALQDWMRPSTS